MKEGGKNIYYQNNSFKNSFINNIVDCFKGKNKGFLIDGNKPNLEDYILHFIDEENDFEDEFKFTKNNTFKQLIYEEVMAKIDGEKIIKYTNEIFDVIDNKVNKLIDKKINLLKYLEIKISGITLGDKNITSKTFKDTN